MGDAAINIVDVFEAAFELPFRHEFIDRIDFPSIKRLAEHLGAYYSDFQFPEKLKGELRPYIFGRYTTSSALNEAFWASSEPAQTPDITLEIKKFLLYSHSICFDDGLIYMLDYFRLSSAENEYTRSAMPMIKRLLHQYVDISRLLRNNIVILVSSEMFPSYNTPHITDDEASDIKARAFDFSQKLSLSPEVLGGIVKEQLFICELAENRMDLYFPHKIYISILESLWRSLGQKFSSRMALEPYRAGIICELQNVDPSRISVDDVISIRQEGAFEEYRGFIRRSFDRVDRLERFSDFETEFAAELRQELADNSERVAKLTKKSNIIKDIWSSKNKVLIGAGVGGLPGLYAGSPWLTVMGAALGGGGKPLLEAAVTSATAPGSKARASAHNHFLALQSNSR